jgi:hypothetical protein
VRITIEHHRTREEAIAEVNKAMQRLETFTPPPPFSMQGFQRSWTGSELTFTVNVGFAGVKSPVEGEVWVTEKDLTIDCKLPAFLTSLVPEEKLRAGVESKVRGLLNP